MKTDPNTLATNDLFARRYTSADFGYLSDAHTPTDTDTHLDIDRLVRAGDTIDERDIAVINEHDESAVVLSLYERDSHAHDDPARVRYSYGQHRDRLLRSRYSQPQTSSYALSSTTTFPERPELSFFTDFAIFVYEHFVSRPYEICAQLVRDDIVSMRAKEAFAHVNIYANSLHKRLTVTLQQTPSPSTDEPALTEPSTGAHLEQTEHDTDTAPERDVLYAHIAAPIVSSEEIMTTVPDAPEPHHDRSIDTEEQQRPNAPPASTAHVSHRPIAHSSFIRTSSSTVPELRQPLIAPTRPPLDLIGLVRDSLSIFSPIIHAFRSNLNVPARTKTVATPSAPAPVPVATVVTPAEPAVAPTAAPVPPHEHTVVSEAQSDRRFPAPRAIGQRNVARVVHASTPYVKTPQRIAYRARIPVAHEQNIAAHAITPSPVPARTKRSGTERLLLAISYLDHAALLKLAFKVWVGMTVTGIVLQTLGVLSF
jgi:hypothetical protein